MDVEEFNSASRSSTLRVVKPIFKSPGIASFAKAYKNPEAGVDLPVSTPQ